MLTGQVELRHLRYFVAVAEQGSVTRAAARLHVSQPPLSRQLRDLEAELGSPLFERTAKSLALSGAGRLFLKDAREILRRCDAAAGAVRAFAAGEHGLLRLGCEPGLEGDVLHEELRRFEQRHPRVRVSIHDLSTEELLQKLLARKLDLALTVPPSADAPLAGLRFVKLKSHALCCAVALSHPLAHRRSLRADQLRTERFVALSSEEYPQYRRWLRTLFLPAAFEPRIGSECDSSSGLLATVGAGREVAIVPAVYQAVAGKRVKLLPVRPALPRLVLGAFLSEPSSEWSSDFLDVAKQVAATSREAKRLTRDKSKIK